MYWLLNNDTCRQHQAMAFFQVFVTDKYLCIAMEYAEGRNVLDCVNHGKYLSEGLGRWYFQQVILALDFCHQKVQSMGDMNLLGYSLRRKHRLPSTINMFVHPWFQKAHSYEWCFNNLTVDDNV